MRSRVINLSEINPTITVDVMKNALIRAASEIFSLEAKLMPVCTPPDDLICFFSDWNFIFGKTISFTASLNKKFIWGTIDLRLDIKNGRIAKVLLYTDALDENLSVSVEQALTNCELSLTTIENQLKSYLIPTQAHDIANLIKDSLL